MLFLIAPTSVSCRRVAKGVVSDTNFILTFLCDLSGISFVWACSSFSNTKRKQIEDAAKIRATGRETYLIAFTFIWI